MGQEAKTKIEYTEQVKNRVPILGLYPSKEELKEEADKRAAEIAQIIARRDARGGRAG